MAAIGTTASSYEILSKLAEGGMAELFLARAVNAAGARRHVVLKRIARERATDTQFVQMFLDEARLASQLRHPNIAQVFDVGRLGVSYFFTMEYVHGVTVQDLIDRMAERKTQLPVSAVLAILAGTSAGLQHAHERTGLDGKPLDIVHRDISPSNLMVSYDGHVKIVDFGVAKAVMSGRPETQAGEIKGKVGYLSPEQCRLQKLDRRSDLYSLGVVAWEMLTGKRLWKRETAFSTMAAIATEDVPLASEYREDLPREVDALVAKLLATEVIDRYQNAGEVIETVELVAASTRTNLSPAQVARLMRELFGKPVEPWLLPEQQHPVAVQAAPIPAELDTHDEDPAVDTVEHKLTSVFNAMPDEDASTNTNLVKAFVDDGSTASGQRLLLPTDRLSTASGERFISQSEETREVPSLRDPQLRQPPIRASTEVLPASELPAPDQQRTLLGPGQLVDPAQQRTLIGEPVAPRRSIPPSSPPPVRLPLTPGPITPMPAVPNSRPLRPSLDPTVPLGTELPRLSVRAIADSGPAVMGGSGPQPFDPPSNRALQVPRWPPPPHGDLGALRWWLIGGALLAIVLLVLVLVSRSSDPRTRVTAPPPADAAVVIVATTSDAAAEPADATSVEADAAATPDAAAAVPELAVDAGAPVDAEPDELDELDQPMPKPQVATKRLRTKPELNAAFRQRRYKDIVIACGELGADGERAVVCTLAACRARDAKAQDWYRNVSPKQRDGTIRICKSAGYTITDICATDLLACRQ